MKLSKDLNVPLTSIMAARLKLFREMKQKHGGYITDGNNWEIRTYLSEGDDLDVLYDGQFPITKKDIETALSRRNHHKVWIESAIDRYESKKDYEEETDDTYIYYREYFEMTLAAGKDGN